MENSFDIVVAEETEGTNSTGHNNDTFSYERLVVLHKTGSSNKNGNSDMPSIDVVHVAVQYPGAESDGISGLSGLLSYVDAQEKRDLLFQSRLPGFLAGGLIEEFVREEATSLLRHLAGDRLREASNTKKAIVFIAYDLGALVVKQALAIAARFQNEYSSIFRETSSVIFYGCLHRALDTSDMSSKLSALLPAKLDSRLQLLFTKGKKHLANTIVKTNESFINCKIARRARIIHLCAGQDRTGMIYPPLDIFTATMGLDSEIVIQEKSTGDLEKRFPGLINIVGAKIENPLPHPQWLPIEQALLALAAPPRASHHDPREAAGLRPLFDRQEYIDWDNFHGGQALFIQGDSYQLTHSVADEIIRNGC
ncbi:hypothetical protein O1611_g268 [Lasiodiplodia mahajangana]|uniref:Uncharacterized protein n=1 Tax=Lasiodiplodia mahajangana TaxID=1108764 RepID=A0ACC2K0P4_9PEZI|nr:hypothetical protein O1611_g268 [Lasiodiplodia mahajangana]